MTRETGLSGCKSRPINLNTLWQFLIDIIERIIPLWIIPPWEAGVRVRFGKHWKEVWPGIHFKIPFFDEFHTMNVKRQIAPCPKQTITTTDGVVMTLSALLTYNVRHPATVWVKIQDFDDSLIALAMQEIHEFVASRAASEVSYDALVEAVLPVLRKNAFSWGAEVEDLGFSDLAAVTAIRLMSDQRTQPILIG